MDVASRLTDRGLGRYAEAFGANGVDDETEPSLDAERQLLDAARRDMGARA